MECRVETRGDVPDIKEEEEVGRQRRGEGEKDVGHRDDHGFWVSNESIVCT